MDAIELVDAVRDALEVDPGAFESAAETDADFVIEEVRDGTFDNHQSIVGLEYEFYAVSEGRWRDAGDDRRYALSRVPRRLLELIGFEKELGLHNAEMRTSPQPFNEHGLRAQEAEVASRLEAALDCTTAEGMRLVSDGIWTIPPAGESARHYLTDAIEEDGVTIATNMSESVRYHAMANWGEGRPAIEAPCVDLDAETVLPESLITSIQPHYQVRQAIDLPRHMNYAIRIAGPLLSLGGNSPFFPPDLYDEDCSPEEILERSHHESRIAVFESVLNSVTDSDKVRFPLDFPDVETAIRRVAEDETMVPIDVSPGNRFDDNFATLRTKHGTYWRWVRPVFDGESRSKANARIEFRPIPAQPTVRDSIAFQATFAGLMEGLTRYEHPAIELPWETAKENFYAAAADGIESEIEWITADGRETSATAVIFEDILRQAQAGLESVGLSESEAEYYIEPIRWRAEHEETPATWKRKGVRRRLDAGVSLADAIVDTQRAYVDNQRRTILGGTFSDW